MKFEQNTCPNCGAVASGILDTIYAWANIMHDPASGEYDYTGSSKVLWDTQEIAESNNDGAIDLQCSNCGESWTTHFDDHKATPPSPIIIKIEGGLVQDIEGIPEDMTVLVRDFDVEGCDDDDIDGVDDDGNEYTEQIYTQGAPV